MKRALVCLLLCACVTTPAYLDPPNLAEWPQVDWKPSKEAIRVDLDALTPEVVASWKPGDRLLLNGKMLTGRDAAHKRILDMLGRGEKLLIVDVREESEYAADHLPGAVHLGKGVLERDVEGKIPDTAAEVILYCGGGFRSALAAEALQKMGYTNVVSVDGGWSALKDLLPTE